MRERLLTALGKQITLEDGKTYQYVITQVEIENALGAVVAILDEFIITDEEGKVYKLHLTKEGNWYEIEAQNKGTDQIILQQLKRAFDQQISEQK